MKNWQLIKYSIAEECKGLKAIEKMLKIFEAYEKDTKGMTHEQKLEYLDRRAM